MLDTDLPLSCSDHLSSRQLSTFTSYLPALLAMMGGSGPLSQEPSPSPATVAQALEVARDSPEGAQEPSIVNILERAITHIWNKVLAQPQTYVMTQGEYSVFNYFQQRFQEQDLAVAARKRYWDHTRGTNGGSS